MPTYSYACTECDNKFDAVQAFTDDALTTCPACQGRLRKLFNLLAWCSRAAASTATTAGSPARATDRPKILGEGPDSAKPSEKPPGKSSEKAAGSGGSGSSSASSSSTPAPASALS